MKNANPVSRLLIMGMIVLGVMSTLVACAKSADDAPTVAKTAKDWFTINVAQTPVEMQLAVTSEEMSQGLMHRRDLQSGQGMLFVYTRPQRVSFWMRNTPTALDIGFFTSDGVLREVYPLFPFDERSQPSQSVEIQFALEVKQGWFEYKDIKPGDQLDLSALKSALQARGLNLNAFDGLGR
jgi:uncharacterized protein